MLGEFYNPFADGAAELASRIVRRTSSAVRGAVSAASVRIRRIATAGTAHLVLTVDETEVEPGRALTVSVKLVPKKDFRVKRAVVQLIRVDTHTLAEGLGAHPWKTREKIAEEKVFIEGKDVKAAQDVEAAIELTVPRDALPTMRSRIAGRCALEISWMVRVKIDIRAKFDPMQEQQIVIGEPLDAGALLPRPAVAESDSGGCSLMLSLDSADVLQGSSLTGVVRVQMRKSARISGAVIEFGGSRGIGYKHESVEVEKLLLSQDMELQAGQIYEWPFQLSTAQADIPSLSVGKSEVLYAVRATLSRRMRSDPRVVQPVEVLPHYMAQQRVDGVSKP